MGISTPRVRTSSSTQVLDELIQLARRCGITVRRERLLREVGYRARSGACRLKDQDYVILDRERSPMEQLEVLADVLRERAVPGFELSTGARRMLGLARD
jgi:hypothetical protein